MAGQAQDDAARNAAPSLPWPEVPLTALVTPDLALEPATLAARVELGRLLFYDTLLSGDRATACATCHSEIWGMSDGLARSVGQGAGLLAGPGRAGGALLPRNAPALWNLVFRESLFWDGRMQGLEEQALTPLRSPEEMNRDPVEVVAELRELPVYRDLFARAFPDGPVPSVEHLASALASFERSLTSLRSLYDGYVAGDALALSDMQVEGMFRFAELGCADCHRPPLFEAERFAARGIGDGVDQGRYAVTENAGDVGAFRVPSLRNAAFTGPYFHDGSVATLDEAVRHELSLSGLPYGEQDVRLLVAFVRDALKDESYEPDRPQALPSGLEVPIDGTQIDR